MIEVAAKPENPEKSTVTEGYFMSKKELFYILTKSPRPYNPYILYKFFTAERLERVGIAPDEYRKIRTFSADQTAAIKRELRALALVK